MSDVSSADYGRAIEANAEYQARQKQVALAANPSVLELEKMIAALDAEIEQHREEAASIQDAIKAETESLAPLHDAVLAAEAKVGEQHTKIGFMQNRYARAKQNTGAAARERAWAVSKLAEKSAYHPLVLGNKPEPTSTDPHADVPGYQDGMRDMRNEARRWRGESEAVDE